MSTTAASMRAAVSLNRCWLVASCFPLFYTMCLQFSSWWPEVLIECESSWLTPLNLCPLCSQHSSKPPIIGEIWYADVRIFVRVCFFSARRAGQQFGLAKEMHHVIGAVHSTHKSTRKASILLWSCNLPFSPPPLSSAHFVASYDIPLLLPFCPVGPHLLPHRF